MPIIFKSKLSSSVANQTFVDKTIDDDKKARLGLFKVSTAEPDYIEDVQVFINNLADTTGQVSQDDPNRKVYATNNILTNGQDRKQALEAFDIAVQLNSDEIDEIQEDILAGTVKIRSYATDSEYEINNPALVGGEVYYNTATGLVRYYSSLDSEWRPVGAQAIGSQSLLGVGNGSNTDFTLPTIPVSDEYVTLYLNGLIVEKTDYTITSAAISFNIAPSAGQRVYATWVTEGTPASPPVASGSFEVDYITLTPTMITNKSLTLSFIPAQPTKVLLDVAEGSTKVYGVDYSVSVNNVTWNTLGLDGQVSAGDQLRFIYIT